MGSPGSGSLHAAVMQNFRSACQIIHGNFEAQMRTKLLLNQRENELKTNPWMKSSLLGVQEQSILFHVGTGKGSTERLDYWVTGRLYSGGVQGQARESYICYQDTAPQVMVELAYRLCFGMHM